jgi:phosphoglucosamine mutase
MAATGRPLAELAGSMPRLPQVLINVRTESDVDLAAPPVRDCVVAVEEKLADRGRVVLRASGTEPVIRVMVEGDEAGEVAAAAEEIARSVRACATGN